MKAVIYARYSSDSQREESIEGQIRECTAFAEKNGITILRLTWSSSGSWTDLRETVTTVPDTKHS